MAGTSSVEFSLLPAILIRSVTDLQFLGLRSDDDLWGHEYMHQFGISSGQRDAMTTAAVIPPDNLRKLRRQANYM